MTARGLGIGAGSTLYYDLEDYDLAPTDCRQAALSFVSGWTEGLHGAGFDSGVYSNIAAAITSLSYADVASHGDYSMPDDIWFAWSNNRADTETGSWVGSDEWNDHERIHQYAIDVAKQSWGGYSLPKIDVNWLDVGKGSVGTTSKPLCRGVDVDLRHYPVLGPGRAVPGSRCSSASCASSTCWPAAPTASTTPARSRP